MSGWEPKPARLAGQAGSAGCCGAVGLLLSPEVVPAGSRGEGRHLPLGPGPGVVLPCRLTSLHRSRSGRREERERVSRDRRWELGQAWLGGQGRAGRARLQTLLVLVCGLRPPQPRLRALGLLGPVSPGRQGPPGPNGLFGSLLKRCCVRGFQTL